jgi:hypothetical protein
MEGNRQAYPCRMSVAGERPSLDEQRAAQLALSPPLGKEDRGREKERRSRGKGGCCRTSRTRAAAGLESVEGGARMLGERREEDGSRCRRSGPCCRVGVLPVKGEGTLLLRRSRKLGESCPLFWSFFLEFRSHFVKGLYAYMLPVERKFE